MTWKSLTDEEPTAAEIKAANAMHKMRTETNAGIAHGIGRGKKGVPDDVSVRSIIAAFEVNGQKVVFIMRTPGPEDDEQEVLVLVDHQKQTLDSVAGPL